jgi:hypothetical protein
MGRITRKPRSVKGQKTGKPVSRYVIRKDSLNRRYAIDKRNGKRVAVSKAEKERKKLKKAAQPFRGIKPKKAPKPPKAVKVKRPAAPKKPKPAPKKPRPPKLAPVTKAEKRRKALSDLAAGRRTIEQITESERPTPVPIATQLGALIPDDRRMRVLNGVVDRMEIFPKVKEAAEGAWNRLQRDSYGSKTGDTPPSQGTLFDRDHGKGMADYIRYEILARARDIQDVEQLIENIIDTDDDYSARELYTLFFSPDVA